jgi:hypothetical protein
MIKNSKLLQEFETNLIRSAKSDYNSNVKIVNALLHYAIKLKKFPPKNKMEGIENDIRYAKAINAIR